METEEPEEKQDETIQSDNDWDNRVLCSDGNCIGVIGSDGHCKECGKAFNGDLPEMSFSENEEQFPAETEDLPPEAEETPETDEIDETNETNETNAAPMDDSWENRVLCSDGNCIGVIGPDGNCKECGKPAE